MSAFSKVSNIAKFISTCKGFDKVTSKVKYLTAGNGNCTASLVLEEEHLNDLGTLHGGLSTTLVDVVSSMGLLTYDTWERPSVSVNINLSYIKAAYIGDEILIDSKILRAGNKTAFLQVEIRNKNTNDVLVEAEHTKCVYG